MLLMESALSAAAPLLAARSLLAAPPMVGEKAPISPCLPSKASPEDLNATRETAYPSTFLIDREGVVFFSKIGKAHGGRTTASEILDALPKRAPAQ
jgi:hypothetical protein